MRQAKVMYKDQLAGMLIQHDDGSFSFKYQPEWLASEVHPAISPTLPKSQIEFHSEYLFPFFYNMLPEGSNKQVACRLNRIDHDDHFGLLLATSSVDTIGAVTLIKTK